MPSGTRHAVVTVHMKGTPSPCVMEGAHFDSVPHLERILGGLIEYCAFTGQWCNANHDHDCITSVHALLNWHMASRAGDGRLKGHQRYALLFMVFFSSFLTEKQDEYDSQQSYAADSLRALASEELGHLSDKERQDFYDFSAEYVQYHLDERVRARKPVKEFLGTRSRPAKKAKLTHAVS
jgi:hypothetical protein